MKRVLITGGTGTFGNALVKHLLATGDMERIVIFSRDEQKQEQMARAFDSQALRFFIGDVRDQARLAMAMRDIEVVFHAAALKIVPIAEYNPFEAVMTNVYGAENVIRAALATGVRQVIALSTDKAVAPVNLYGATKLCAEKLFVAANNLGGDGGTRFSVVRYGNVAGSRGSVLPYFLELKRRGDPIPVTDVRMTRFWITIEDAVKFVLDCRVYATGRDIFIPKMPSLSIIDMAEEIAGDLPIYIVGMRPGEKLHEFLITRDEAPWVEEWPTRFVIRPEGDLVNAYKVPDDFTYSSGRNKQWLTMEQLRNHIAGGSMDIEPKKASESTKT